MLVFIDGHVRAVTNFKILELDESAMQSLSLKHRAVVTRTIAGLAERHGPYAIDDLRTHGAASEFYDDLAVAGDPYWSQIVLDCLGSPVVNIPQELGV